MRSVLFFLGLFIFGFGANQVFATDPVISVTHSVKWHPGHYYTLMKRHKTPKHLKQIYSELENTPAMRGIQVRITWLELENNRGSYDFSYIDQLLAELSKRNKRLVILLQTRSFTTQSDLVPDYLRADLYEDGIFTYTSFEDNSPRGHNIKLWNPNVYERLVALIQALGEQYNSHPFFEGIGFSETAMGQPVQVLTNAQLEGYYNNLLNLNQELRKYFPNTMTYQFTNYPRKILPEFVSGLQKIGTGLGGPDIFLDEPRLKDSQKGIYNYYNELAGFVPLTPSVMPLNYIGTRKKNSERVPATEELFIFARDQLKANYIFWTRTPKHYRDVLDFLNSPEIQKDHAGGLDTSCPKSYTSCIDK